MWIFLPVLKVAVNLSHYVRARIMDDVSVVLYRASGPTDQLHVTDRADVRVLINAFDQSSLLPRPLPPQASFPAESSPGVIELVATVESTPPETPAEQPRAQSPPDTGPTPVVTATPLAVEQPAAPTVLDTPTAPETPAAAVAQPAAEQPGIPAEPQPAPAPGPKPPQPTSPFLRR